MSVMLGDMAVDAVVQYLNGQQIETPTDNPYCRCGRFLTAFKYERPDGKKGEYIAVNHLPFVHKDAVCEGIVNINIHVPKVASGLPNTKRLGELAQAVVALFPDATFLRGAYYEFLSDSRPTPDGDDTYYVNIQINVIFNNLNT